MNEKQFEKNNEKIPTEKEILEVISRFAKDSIFVRKLSDNKGLYLLEVKIEGKKLGEFIEYLYIRKGKFPNQNEARETTIYITYYEDEIPINGYNVADYDSATGEWKKVE